MDGSDWIPEGTSSMSTALFWDTFLGYFWSAMVCLGLPCSVSDHNRVVLNAQCYKCELPPSPCCQVQRRLLMFKVLMRSSLIYVKIMANVITEYNIHFYWEICFPNDAISDGGISRNCYTLYMTKDARIKDHNQHYNVF